MSGKWRFVHQVWSGVSQHEPCSAQGVPGDLEGTAGQGTEENFTGRG